MTAYHTSTLSAGTASFLILVVDDEVTMRRSLADILRLEGYHVQMAKSGEEALQHLQNETYDLILLDLKMPGVSGVEVLRFVAKTAPDTRVILLTAHGSLESAIEALRLGAQDYLLKPSSPETILSSVAKALKTRVEILQNQELLSHLESSVQAIKETKETTPLIHPQKNASFGNGVCVDFEQRVIWNENLQISLTYTESKLLKILLENRDTVFTHQELVSKVQGYDTSRQEAPVILRPLVSRLRRKLSKFSGSQDWIVNVRGKGYRFDPRKISLPTNQETR